MSRHRGQIVFVPEAATQIMGRYHDILPPDWFMDENIAREFQRLVVAEQLFALRLAIAEANRRGIDLIITDRGVLDGEAYGGRRADGLVNIDISELVNLYDEVIFLAPAPLDVWERICDDNPTRRENYEEMIALSEGLRNVWSNHHPNFVEIDGGTWDEKLANALKAIFRS